MQTLLAGLASCGVRLSVAGDNLRLDAPSGTVTAELLTQVRSRKAELLAYVREANLAEALSLWVDVFGPLPTHTADLLDDDLMHITGDSAVDAQTSRLRELLVGLLDGRTLPEWLDGLIGDVGEYVVSRDERGWFAVTPKEK